MWKVKTYASRSGFEEKLSRSDPTLMKAREELYGKSPIQFPRDVGACPQEADGTSRCDYEQPADVDPLERKRFHAAVWSGGIVTSDYAVSRPERYITLESMEFYKMTDMLDWIDVPTFWTVVARPFFRVMSHYFAAQVARDPPIACHRRRRITFCPIASLLAGSFKACAWICRWVHTRVHI